MFVPASIALAVREWMRLFLSLSLSCFLLSLKDTTVTSTANQKLQTNRGLANGHLMPNCASKRRIVNPNIKSSSQRNRLPDPSKTAIRVRLRHLVAKKSPRRFVPSLRCCSPPVGLKPAVPDFFFKLRPKTALNGMTWKRARLTQAGLPITRNTVAAQAEA